MRATGAHAAQNLTDFQPLAICGDDDGTARCLYVGALGTRWMPTVVNPFETAERLSLRIQLVAPRGRERKGAAVTAEPAKSHTLKPNQQCPAITESKRQPQSELDLPGRECGTDLPEAGVGTVHLRIGEVGAIEGVEGFGAQLQRNVFAEFQRE